jgi:hypothetical protein
MRFVRMQASLSSGLKSPASVERPVSWVFVEEYSNGIGADMRPVRTAGCSCRVMSVELDKVAQLQ